MAPIPDPEPSSGKADRVETELIQGWLWPTSDTELRKVAFSRLPDLAAAVGLCRKRRTAIQAGAALGVWPAFLTKFFNHTITFEPSPKHFDTLLGNLEDHSGPGTWELKGCGLGIETASAQFHTRPANSGATWLEIDPSGSILVAPIDSLELEDVDLIQLDIEGAEYFALLGAKRTISRDSPVVMIEDHKLGEQHYDLPPFAASRLLEAWGYRLAEQRHRDRIYVRDL